MPSRLPRKRLLRISQAKKSDVSSWMEGVSIEQASGETVSKVILSVAADRWGLGFEQRRQANKLMTTRPPLYRNAVSRYYYAMYHAMRACCYVSHGGDDHQDHRELPQHIPGDFAPAEDWQSKLKNARTVRNQADYDPYPKSDRAFRTYALALKNDADRLLTLTRNYLRSKGCAL